MPSSYRFCALDLHIYLYLNEAHAVDYHTVFWCVCMLLNAIDSFCFAIHIVTATYVHSTLERRREKNVRFCANALCRLKNIEHYRFVFVCDTKVRLLIRMFTMLSKRFFYRFVSLLLLVHFFYLVLSLSLSFPSPAPHTPRSLWHALLFEFFELTHQPNKQTSKQAIKQTYDESKKR